MYYKAVFKLVFAFIFVSCNGQGRNEFKYEEISKKNIVNIPVSKLVRNIKFINLESYLPLNFVKNGTVDYTQFIQKGMDENRNVLLPNFPILVNESGLILKSNSSIYFNKESKIIMVGNKLTNYDILKISHVENIKLFNPTISGDRFNHLDTKGEWGMGINILSSKNIAIYNPTITNCWGDGIYVGRNDIPSENISIKGGLIDNNRRNGISVISGQNIYISDVHICNTNGTFPMSGIDVEPNNNSDELINIKLNNINTFNNAENGISVILIYLIGENKKNVSLTISNHKDVLSKRGFLMGGNKESYSDNIIPLEGFVSIVNPIWTDNKTSLGFSSDIHYIPKFNYKGLKVFTKNKFDSDKTKDVKQAAEKRNIKIE